MPASAIIDRESFESYRWPDPDTFDYSSLEIGEEFAACRG